MYFSDITNPELEFFHGLNVPNFSISLTDMLSSNLFKVETIIADTLYRVYPLFYSKEITSNNSDDKIIENKCIICNKRTHETYYRFISDTTKPVIAFDTAITPRAIDYDLSDEQFNAMVQLFRSKNSFTDEFNLISGLVNTDYASYVFDLDSTTIIDNGILITNETLTNIGTVRLLNPVFKYSTYVLHLKVYSTDDVNIDIASQNNIEVTDLDITLVENTDVQIPFDTLEINNIIGFEATVSITHDKSIIQFTDTIELTVGESSFIEEDVTLTTTVKSSGVPVTTGTVTFYDGETSIGTASLGEGGIATLDYSPSAAKEYEFKAEYNNIISNTIFRTITKTPTTLTLSADTYYAYIPTSFTVSGVLKKNGSAFADADVKLYRGGALFDTLTTDENGEFSKTINVSTQQIFNFHAVYDGTSAIDEAISEYVTVNAKKKNARFTNISISPKPVRVNQSETLIAYLMDDEALSNQEVKLYKGSTVIATGNTDANGKIEFTYSFTQTGRNTLRWVFEETSSHYATGIYFQVDVQ